MRVPGTEYRPDEPVIREINLAPEGLERNEVLFYGMDGDAGEYCQVSAGTFTYRIEPVEGTDYRIERVGVAGSDVISSSDRIVLFRKDDMSVPIFWVENDEGILRIVDGGSPDRAVVSFPYDMSFELAHGGIIRCPENREQRSALVRSLYEYDDRDPEDGYTDHDLALQLYKERIMDAALAKGTVIATRLFDELEVAEAEILTLAAEERRSAFEQAFAEVRAKCERAAS